MNENILRLIELAKRTHYYCEDAWYSCPLAEDGCSDDSYPKNKCNCGADEHNRKVEELFRNLAST